MVYLDVHGTHDHGKLKDNWSRSDDFTTSVRCRRDWLQKRESLFCCSLMSTAK